MKFPNLPRKGKSIEDDVKDIINYLRSSRVVNIVGGRLMRSPNGTTIEVLPGKSKASEQKPTTSPLTIVSGSEEGLYKITPGYVNQEMPTLGAAALDAETAPEHAVSADTWFWIKVVATYDSTDTYVVTIQTTTTSDAPTGAEITGTGFTSYRLIGKVDYTASPEGWAIKNYTNGGNVGVDSFGSIVFWWLA